MNTAFVDYRYVTNKLSPVLSSLASPTINFRRYTRLQDLYYRPTASLKPGDVILVK